MKSKHTPGPAVDPFRQRELSMPANPLAKPPVPPVVDLTTLGMKTIPEGERKSALIALASDFYTHRITRKGIRAGLGVLTPTEEQFFQEQVAIVALRMKQKTSGKRAATSAERVTAQSSRLADIGAVGKCADHQRRESCRLDLRAFLLTYHAATCEWPFAPAHLELIADLQRIIFRGGRKVIAMPRGSGKTSICIGAVEWSLLYGHRRFVVVPAATQEAAENILQAVFSDLEGAELLAADFPAVCVPFARLNGGRQRCLSIASHCSAMMSMSDFGGRSSVASSTNTPPSSLALRYASHTAGCTPPQSWDHTSMPAHKLAMRLRSLPLSSGACGHW